MSELYLPPSPPPSVQGLGVGYHGAGVDAWIPDTPLNLWEQGIEALLWQQEQGSWPSLVPAQPIDASET